MTPHFSAISSSTLFYTLCDTVDTPGRRRATPESAGENGIPMRASLSPTRLRAVISFAGGALCLIGFFLPMFTESTPGVSGSAHPVYEWQVVPTLPSASALASFLAVLSLLAALIVLVTSVATWFIVCGPRLVLLKDLVAAWGLAIQLSLDFIVLQALSTRNAQTEIAWGFFVPLIGFFVILASAVRLQTIFTPLTCVLLAVGSVILGLTWVFFDFFSWYGYHRLVQLAPIVHVAGRGHRVHDTGAGLTTAPTLPLVLVALYGLYYLLLGIGAIPCSYQLPSRSTAAIVILILLNGTVVWVTRRLLPAEQRETTSGGLNRRTLIQALTRSTISLAIGGLFVKVYYLGRPIQAMATR